MSDKPKHIQDLQLKLWLEKKAEKKLADAMKNIEAMRTNSRQLKNILNLPTGNFDPLRENRKRKKNKPGPQ